MGFKQPFPIFDIFRKLFFQTPGKDHKMKFSLKEKSAIVTGRASGIGKAISETFAGQGATVHILEMNMELAQSVADAIKNHGGKAVAHQCDVSVQEQAVKAIKSIAANGGLDILVNNAGIAHVGNLENTSEADFDKIYRVNIKGVYNCMYASLPFLKTNGGVILNMASVASSVGISDRFAYSMSKGAVLTMTYSVAKDFIAFGIRCNSISPARIFTPFVDGFIKKTIRERKKRCFKNYPKPSPSAGWEPQRKWPILHYIYVQMKLLL